MLQNTTLNQTDPFRAFVELVARLTKDQECPEHPDADNSMDEESTDGWPETCAVCGGELFDMTNDDAVDTLHSLISQARKLTKNEQT